MPVRGKDGSYYDSVDEVMRANTQWEQREKQNKLLEEQNRIAQQRFQMEQQQLQMQQQVMQQQQEFERQRQQERKNQEIKEKIEAQQRSIWNKVVNDFSKIGMQAGDVSSFISMITQGPKYKREEEIKAMLKSLKEEHRLLKLNEDNYDYEKHINKIRDYEIQLKNCKRGLFASKEDKQKYAKLKKKLDDLKFEFNVIQEDYPNTPENRNILKEVKARIPENEKETKKLEEELKEIQEYNNVKKEEIRQAFNEFRRSHYNKEVEFVFKDNGFGIDFIKPSEAIKEGTVEDYKNYMRETLINIKLED